jgi:hypothetical protein
VKGPDARPLRDIDTEDMSRPEHRECKLRLAARDAVEICPEERCAFWEPGGAVLDGNCLIERLAIDLTDRELAEYLLQARERLERARDSAEAERAHREFAHRLGRDV